MDTAYLQKLLDDLKAGKTSPYEMSDEEKLSKSNSMSGIVDAPLASDRPLIPQQLPVDEKPTLEQTTENRSTRMGNGLSPGTNVSPEPEAAPAPQPTFGEAKPAAAKPLDTNVLQGAAPAAPTTTELSATPAVAEFDPQAELAAAIRRREQEIGRSMMLEGSGQINQALTQQSVNPMESFTKAMRDNADRFTKDVSAKQDAAAKTVDAQLKKLDFASKLSKSEYDKQSKDPNSEMSRAYRQTLASMGYNFGDKLSAYDVQNNDGLRLLIQSKENAEARKLQSQMLQEQRLANRSDRQEKITRDEIGQIQDRANKDKLIIKAKEKLAAADEASDLLNSRIPIAGEAAKTAIAKLSGQVGVLTDRDVAVFGGSQALTARLNQSIEQAATGQLTAENRGYLLKLVDVMRQRASKQVESRTAELAEQGSKRLGIPASQIKQYIAPSSESLQLVPMVGPKGQKLLVPEDKVAEAESRGAKRQ